MHRIGLRHKNDCPRCPVIGQENTPNNEQCRLLSLRFDIRIARELCRDRPPHLVEPRGLCRWLQQVSLDWEHVDHLPPTLGPGIMVTLPAGCGMPLIDGNHRAARAIRDRKDFFAVVLSERETLELLCRSLGDDLARNYWLRMAFSQLHPKDHPQGEQR